MEEPNKADLPKAYEPKAVEDRIYAAWEQSGFFNPDKLPGERPTPFTVMMPPPNRTGILHVGHATGIALQDLMIRYNRMAGKKALWLPGTDHAAIATQVKVEGLLIKEGIENPRATLGREKFLERVVQFAEESGATIIKQTKKMGASCDWDRLAYTFDEPRNRAVNEMFSRMFADGIIERGYRIVNWDPQFRTTLSDDEVQTKEVKARFLTFSYDKDFPIVISTTRPETKFGDTAVAVHPDDERYKEYVGKTFEPVFCGKKLSIKVIADNAVDPAFGTGALGVTPAHSMIDADLAVRHGLPTVQVIGEDGRMNENAGQDFAGLTVTEARAKIEQLLSAAGLLKNVEEIPQNLPVAERGGAPVEQLPKDQWFVRVNKPFTLRQDTLGKWKKGEQATLKELMGAAVSSGAVKILPEQFEKVYFHWIDNLRDWCISRQIWFGHRIPAWYKDGKMKIGPASPGEGWEQDQDTLDTWFSSGTWTFSTLGWPDAVDEDGQKTGDLATYHPTDVLETGRDIIFFWVARMILMSAYALGEIPFKNVYLHGLVRDEQGRKMSKSLGNIIDPLDVAEKYGTDAVRLSLTIGNSPGNDMRISEEKIAYFRNFTNKLWNISRFVLMLTQGATTAFPEYPEPRTLADKWILARLSQVISSVTKDLNDLNFSRAGETLRDFTWNELADWYLEVAKIEDAIDRSQYANIPEEFKGAGKREMLTHLLLNTLKLWHPFMPFVTEEVYRQVRSLKSNDFLMVQAWPTAAIDVDEKAVTEFALIQDIVTAIRTIRSTYKVEPGKKIDAFIAAGQYAALLKENTSIIEGMAKVGALTIVDKGEKPPQAVSAVVSGLEISVPLGTLVDFAAEKKRLTAELENAKKYVVSLAGRLANEEFVARAPAKVIDAENAKLAAAKEKTAKLEEQLKDLG